ncbi:reverse transcriptase domain-containing protein [Tanacetum coccineum]|uniref:Reverse transcriptase domain-containing protein n=1 Tax=Tanacetum coccineum TaxID=301880 RepID=A0ABQ5FFS0_9ASTR
MRTRNSNFPNNSTVTIPRRRNRRRAPNVVEPELRTIVEVAPMAERTMEELLRAPTEGYGEAIVIPEINADHFEIKTNLLQLVQASPFHGFERENPHTHINNFKRITSTLKFRDVPNDVIKLMMFPYSLEGAARVCEAWERFKEMLRACPHHGFTELTQIDTFYNGLNDNDQDSLNAAAGGNLLSKTTREALNIIENKSKVRYSRNKSNVSRMNTTSRESFSKTDERIDKLADQISTLVEIVSKKVVTPATVKAVEESCVTCGSAHAWYNCPNTDNNQSSVCAATGTYNQVAPPNRVSNHMAPPGFAPVQNNGQNSLLRLEEPCPQGSGDYSQHDMVFPECIVASVPLRFLDSRTSLISFETSDSLLKEFTDELALLDPFPLGNKDVDVEADLGEIELLLNRDPSINFSPTFTIDPNPKKFTDEPAPACLPPLGDDESFLKEDILEDVKSKDSNVSNFDEPVVLNTPLFGEDECFDPGGEIDKIDAFMDAYNDSEGDVLEILHNFHHIFSPKCFLIYDHKAS